jgi:hypothetical protein
MKGGRVRAIYVKKHKLFFINSREFENSIFDSIEKNIKRTDLRREEWRKEIIKSKL